MWRVGNGHKVLSLVTKFIYQINWMISPPHWQTSCFTQKVSLTIGIRTVYMSSSLVSELWAYKQCFPISVVFKRHASPTILPLTKSVSSSWGMRYLKVVLLLLVFNGIYNIFALPLQIIEFVTFMNGDKYAKLQNLILKGAPAGSLLMFFPDGLDHDCKVQQLNSSFQGRGKMGFHLCCWNKK